MNTHLGLKKRERETQLKTIIQLLNRESAVPTLLAGDFNEWKRMIVSHPLRELEREINMVPYQGTFPARLPLFPLDRIFYRGNIHLLDFHVHKSSLSRIASDHLPLTAKFSLT
jgi:endonuclease/exonuclease/phosphatase family metal-dependent hydrolase